MEWYVGEDGRCVPVDHEEEFARLIEATRARVSATKLSLAASRAVTERVRRALRAQRLWRQHSRTPHTIH
jgi:hypothetical protein